MKYRCVIFDLDGTLLNTLDDLKNAVNAALEKRGYAPRTQEEVRLFVGNGVAKLIERAVPAGTSAEEAAAILEDFREYYNTHINVETHPYAGIAALLGKLRAAGVKVGVNSNKYDAAVQLLMNDHFPGLFDKAVGESATVPKKPSPIGVETLLKALGADAESAVYGRRQRRGRADGEKRRPALHLGFLGIPQGGGDARIARDARRRRRAAGKPAFLRAAR